MSEVQPSVSLPLADWATPAKESWQDEALCAETDPETFFPEKGGSPSTAKRICGSCDVAAQCLEYALRNGEMHGIWGGLSTVERLRLAGRRARVWAGVDDETLVMLHELGMPDVRIAVEMGWSAAFVGQQRNRLGLPTIRSQAAS